MAFGSNCRQAAFRALQTDASAGMRSIGDLLKAENPATPIEHSLFDPMEEIGKVCSFYEAIAEEHGATITSRGGGRLFGDQVMFGRVISNLVANALYYSPPRVKIDIFVREASDHYLEVFVTDTGYGMEARELSRIFDRFYRVESLRRRHPEGSGLGLSISTAIAEGHGGRIEVGDRRDGRRGARFTFYVPTTQS